LQDQEDQEHQEHQDHQEHQEHLEHQEQLQSGTIRYNQVQSGTEMRFGKIPHYILHFLNFFGAIELRMKYNMRI